MSQPFIYIVSLNKKYLTNKMNVTALWDVVVRELEEDKNLEFSYLLEKDGEFQTEIGRKSKIKKLCQNTFKNQIVIHRKGEFDEEFDVDQSDFMWIFQDILRGKDNEGSEEIEEIEEEDHAE